MTIPDTTTRGALPPRQPGPAMERYARQTRNWVTVLAAALAVLAVIAVTTVPAHATAAPLWMVKGQDLNLWDNGGVTSKGLLAQAAADGASVPPVTWVLCGVYNGVVYGQSDITPCTAGDTLVVEDYTRLQAAANAGVFAAGITSAVYDLESWSLTPASQNGSQGAAVSAINKAMVLSKKLGITLSLIISSGGKLGRCSACWTAAAKDGSYMMAIQSQGWGWSNGAWCLSCWEQQVSSAASVVRNARKSAGTGTLVMIGMGTDTPLIHPVWLLVDEYNYAQSIGITRFWVNANNWGTENQCNASQGGPGCPEIAMQFWERIGAA